MGPSRPILNPNPQSLEELRTASLLSSSVIVENVDTVLGPTLLVGAADLVFTKKSFVVFWFWSMMGGKVYEKNISQDEFMRDILVELNPQLFAGWNTVEPSAAFNSVYRKLNRVFKDWDIVQKANTLQRVVAEMPG